MQHQYFSGMKFYLDKKTGYWISTISNPRKRMHVVVWEHYNGKVCKGFLIHHKDCDKSNNSIDNLILLRKAEHLKLHAELLSKDQRLKKKEHVDRIRNLTKKWHSSKAGSEWHIKHAKVALKRKSSVLKQCKCCNKEFTIDKIDEAKAKFCSNACKSRHRRKMGTDYIEMICNCCGKIYRRNKYARRSKSFCGISCARKSYWNKSKEHQKG